MEMEGDLGGVKLGIREIVDESYEGVSSIVEYSIQGNQSNEELKRRAFEVGVKAGSLMEKVLELEKKEERLREVEEREKKIGLFEKPVTLRLEKQGEDNDVKQCMESCSMRLVLVEKEVECLSKLIDKKSCHLKEKVSIERCRKEAELSLRQLGEKEKELSLREEAIKQKKTEVEKKMEVTEAKLEELRLLKAVIKEKRTDVERKEQIFEAKEKAKTDEMEQKSKLLEWREKKLEEMVLEFELKRREFENTHDEEEDIEVLVVDDESDEEDLEPLQMLETHDEDEDIEEVFLVDDESHEEDPERLLCADPEFNDFNKSKSSLAVGQVWAMYDPLDAMPRLYARIKQITKCQSLFQVEWMEPKDEETVPVACGSYIPGNTETIESILAFSYLMHPVRHGRNVVAVHPEIGETWALFRDWSKKWDTNPEQHKPPYEYDFVEVILISDKEGVGVTYLDKVEGFVSLFSQSVQREVISFFIKPDELHRFSHKVPSFRMTGEEKEGVPPGSFELDPAAIPNSPGSFELDPAAIPNSIIKVEHSTYEETKGTEGQFMECRIAGEVNDIPIVTDASRSRQTIVYSRKKKRKRNDQE